MKAQLLSLMVSGPLLIAIPACMKSSAAQHEEHHEAHTIVATSPIAKDVVNTQNYVCQIHSRRHIEVCALESGYLEEIPVKEGQVVKQGDLMFKILPSLYQAKFDSEEAEARLVQIEFNNTQQLFRQNVVSQQEVALAQAKLAKAQAKVNLAKAELNFTKVTAPFDGIVDRLHKQHGSLVEEGEMLTTLSDNSVMWVYFNVPEADYLAYKQSLDHSQDELQLSLVLANGQTFPYPGKIGAIEADFNNETGNIAFRADFPNPMGLLRHGQTGTIQINQIAKNAIVIPQRATFDILAKKYAYVLEQPTAGDNDEHAHDQMHSSNQGEGEDPFRVQLVAQAETGANAESNHSAQVIEAGAIKVGAAEPMTATHDTRVTPHGIVRQREITVLNELEDVYVIQGGLGVHDKIVLEGVQQVRDGESVAYEFRSPEVVLENLKYKAE